MSKLRCCVFFVLSIALAVFIVWFLYILTGPHGPRCYIRELYIPALDLSLDHEFTIPNNSFMAGKTLNPSLFFDLCLRNGLKYYRVRYDNITLTFSYGGNRIASHVIPSFFQGRKNTANRHQVVETHGLPWEGVYREVANGSKVVFRVDLATKARFYQRDSESGTWTKRKTKNLRVGTDVEVDGSGMKVPEGYNRLNHAAPKPGVGFLALSIIFILNLVLM